jgi:opacity protein-like surface antigen
MAGAAVYVVSDVMVDIGYRYFDAGEFKKDAGTDIQDVFNNSRITSSATGDLAAHELMINLGVPRSVLTR